MLQFPGTDKVTKKKKERNKQGITVQSKTTTGKTRLFSSKGKEGELPRAQI